MSTLISSTSYKMMSGAQTWVLKNEVLEKSNTRFPAPSIKNDLSSAPRSTSCINTGPFVGRRSRPSSASLTSSTSLDKFGIEERQFYFFCLQYFPLQQSWKLRQIYATFIGGTQILKLIQHIHLRKFLKEPEFLG